MTDLAILVPVLRRPHRVAPLLNSIREATPAAPRVLFVCTPGDAAEIDAVVSAGAEYICTAEPFPSGDYSRKINLGYRSTTESLVFLAADDLHFHPGWLDQALEHLLDGVGVVGTNDLTNRRTRREHSTHSLVTREYADTFGTIDEPGKILHEGYPHEFCDDELVQTAQHRRAYAHADHSHVEHLHPMAGKAPMDDLYAQQASRMKVGRRIFERRRELWT